MKEGIYILNVTVIQPKYYAGENPDEKISEFILNELYGEGLAKNNDFISAGLCPEAF